LTVSQEKDPELESLSDEQLALALKRGDEGAFDVLVSRHQSRVYAVAYRFTSNREDALDVTQEALLKVYRKIGAWQPTGGFVPWLLRLTSNQAVDMLRRRKRHQHEQLIDEVRRKGGHAPVEPASMATDEQVRAREIDDRVQRALDVLSPTQRIVFVLRHYEGLQLADIAVAVGCTVGSVKVHLFRALKKLQKELKDLYSG